MNPTTFAQTQLSLLLAEQSAETAATTSLLRNVSPTSLARAGLAITNLVLSSQRTGLGGKTVLELEQDKAIGNDGIMGEHGIRVGDIVRFGAQPRGGERKKEKTSLEEKGCEGVVVRVANRGVQIALGEEKEEDLAGRLWV
jgi:DNA polymerase alpha-associated DNA helicase A